MLTHSPMIFEGETDEDLSICFQEIMIYDKNRRKLTRIDEQKSKQKISETLSDRVELQIELLGFLSVFRETSKQCWRMFD